MESADTVSDLGTRWRVFLSPSGGVPLAGCGEFIDAHNFTLTLSAYFSSTRDVKNSYPITYAQLNCPPLNL